MTYAVTENGAMMENLKKFLKIYWKLIVIEVAIVAVYWGVSPVDKNSRFNIFVSPEILATILVAVGAIYSWLNNKSDREYDKNLQMLKDIEAIGKHYKNKADERNIINLLQNHIDELEQIEEYKGKFLETYLQYIKDKIDPSKNEEEQFGSSKSSLSEIKDKISKEYGISVNNVKYSKSYMDSAQENNFKWTTWYSLRKSFIENVEDTAKLIFFTNVDGKYTGVLILGENLKKLSNQMKSRNKKNGDPQFDFYITKKEDGSFFENRNGISLDEYIEAIEFQKVNNIEGVS